jgi:hypothetical protein
VDPLQTLVDFSEFRSGLWAGLLVTLVVALVGLVVRTAHPKAVPLGLAGPAFCLAGLTAIGGWLGFDAIWPVPRDLVLGLLACLLGGEVAARTRHRGIWGAFLVAPGALLVSRSEDFGGPGWVVWLVFVGIVLGGAFSADLDRRVARLGLGPVLLLVSVGGLYATVPDTELARPLVGAAIPLALCGWPLRVARLGAGGTPAAIALFLWVAAFEGLGRPGSIVGAFGALALLLTEPIGRRLGRGRVVGLAKTLSIGRLELVVVGAQVVLALYASRLAGFEEDGLAAFLFLVPALVIGVLAGAALGLSSRLRPRPRGAGPPRRARSQG